MQELGIPDNMNGQPDYDRGWPVAVIRSAGRTGGSNTTGVVIDSGVLNPDLLKGEKESNCGTTCVYVTASMR